MNKLWSSLHIIDNVNEWAGRITSIAIYATAALLVFEIGMRNLFNIGLPWPHDISLFFFGLILLAGGHTLLHRRMVSMDLLHSRWSLRTRAIVDVCTASFFYLFIGLLVLKAAEMAGDSIRVWEVDRFSYAPPIYITKTMVPIAGLLLLLQGTAKFIRDFYSAVTGKVAP